MKPAGFRRPGALVQTLLLLPALAAAAGSPAGEPGWLHYGGDQGGRHFSPSTQINRDNVADLEVAWVHRSGDMARYGEEMAKTSTQSTPILLPPAAGESLVYCTPFNRVIALDPATGEQRWDFDPAIDRRGDRPFRCRGVAYGEEPAVPADAHCRHRLYLGTHDRKLWAIDARDGRPCAEFGDRGPVTLSGGPSTVPAESHWGSSIHSSATGTAAAQTSGHRCPSTPSTG